MGPHWNVSSDGGGARLSLKGRLKGIGSISVTATPSSIWEEVVHDVRKLDARSKLTWVAKDVDAALAHKATVNYSSKPSVKRTPYAGTSRCLNCGSAESEWGFLVTHEQG